MIKIDEKDPVVAEYRAAVAELTGLQNQLGKVVADIDCKTQVLTSLRQQSQPSRLDNEAGALLSGGSVNDEFTVHEEIVRLEHVHQVTERAIEMQKQVVDRVKGPYSIMLNEAQRGRHEEIIARMAKAMIEIATSLDDEISLFQELTEADAGPRLRPMRVNAVGTLRDQNSVVSVFIREIREYFPKIAKRTEGDRR